MNSKRHQALLDEARTIAQKALVEERPLTSEEQAKLTSLVGTVETEKKIEALQSGFGPGNGGGSLYGAFKAAGWSPGKKVYVPRENLKTASFTGSTDDLSPISREGAALGFDRRYLAEVFPSTGIANDVSSVDVYRQASRTLPAAADVQRTFLETSQKAEVASARELVSESVGILAAIESDVPNRLLIQDGVRSMIDNDLRLAILEARDDAIVDAINAANPDTSTAGSNLLEEVRHAIAAMLDQGYSPSVLALNPSTAAEFDLLQTEGPEGFYVFGPSNAGRAWNMRIVEVKNLANPLLIAPAQAGHRYEGALALEAFEQDAGQTNQSTVRLEQSFLFAVERTDAILEIVTGS